MTDEPSHFAELVPFLRGKVAALEGTIRQLSTAGAFPVRGEGVALETAIRLERERDEAIVEQKKSERRHVEWHDRIWRQCIELDQAIRDFDASGADVDAGPWAKLDAAIKSWRVFVGIPADGFKK